MVGDRDGMTTTAQSETAAKALPQGALQVFPNTHHPLEKLNVEMMAEALTRFLQT